MRWRQASCRPSLRWMNSWRWPGSASALAPLGANRDNYRGQKETLYGENAVLNDRHGAAYMLRNRAEYS